LLTKRRLAWHFSARGLKFVECRADTRDVTATRSPATGSDGRLPSASAARQVYRRFLAASDEIGATVLHPVIASKAGRDTALDEPAAAWAKDAAPVILDRVGAALLAGDAQVLFDYLSVELSELRRTGISEVHLIALLDALMSGTPEDLAPARRVLAEGRDHLLRSGARPVRAVSPIGAAPSTPSGSRPGSGGANSSAPQAPGPAFTDLLLLGALACQAPVALLSVPQSDGTWSTLAYGLDSKESSHDGQLFQAIAASDGPVEIPDLTTRLPRSPLTQAPHAFRWAYGLGLRQEGGAVIGVVLILDRCVRPVTSREQQALASLARQLGAQLVQWVRPADAGLVDAGRVMSFSSRKVHPAGTGQLAPDTAPAAPGLGGGRPSATADPAADATSVPGTPGGSMSGRSNLLRSHEVAQIFDVTERTVINWAAGGKLPSLRTVGGHLRFRRDDIARLLSTPTSPPIG
jgi:excisionase family DNA binding protein